MLKAGVPDTFRTAHALGAAGYISKIEETLRHLGIETSGSDQPWPLHARHRLPARGRLPYGVMDKSR
jgi:hypothetical protein